MTELIIGLLMGLSLAAASGLRVFVPILLAALASRLGLVELGAGFAFLESDWLLLGLLAAAGAEVVGYSVPWVDHALDAAATPLAALMGMIVAASPVHGALDALSTPADAQMAASAGAGLAGAGLASAVQAATVSARGLSLATTGGLLNPVVAWIETALATLWAIVAVIAPVLTGLIVLWAAWRLGRRWWRRRATGRLAPWRSRDRARSGRPGAGVGSYDGGDAPASKDEGVAAASGPRRWRAGSVRAA